MAAVNGEFAKVVLVGAANVGKTSVISCGFEGKFSPDCKATIGSGFAKGTVTGNTRSVRLEVWDTAGQEIFQSLTSLFFTGASAAVLVYDVTARASFDQLEKHLKMVRDHAEPSCIVAVAGNKVDLCDDDPSLRKVSFTEGKAFAKRMECPIFLETSACTGFGVDLLFAGIVDHPGLLFADSMHQVTLKPVQKKKGGCC